MAHTKNERVIVMFTCRRRVLHQRIRLELLTFASPNYEGEPVLLLLIVLLVQYLERVILP